MVRDLPHRAVARAACWSPEAGDAVLYAAAALFAGLTAEFTAEPPYHTWGELALGPYLVGAVGSALLSRHRSHARSVVAAGAGGQRVRAARSPIRGMRLALFVFVLFGAMLMPLSVEVALRSEGGPATHVQPEVQVIDQAAQRAAHGQDPYHAYVKHHHLVSPVPGEPAYESFFPYLPVMIVFGLPSSTHHPIRLTDTRIFFTMFTLLVVALALALCRGPSERKLRTLQVLVALPTAALPLATGGDDMPIVALLLLAMVLAQRRAPGWSGLVFGIVSAMKFTAWPLAALALFAARDRQGRRQPLRMALGMAVVVVPVVAPFAAHNAEAFVQNVILFPLGLAGISSPAASNLPGHLLVTALPSLHTALPLAVAAVGGIVLIRHLRRRPPATSAEVAAVVGWVMLIAILFAPATRVGYLLYPVNFFVWAYLLRGADEVDDATRLLERAAASLELPERSELPVPVG